MKLIPVILFFVSQIAAASVMDCKAGNSPYRVSLDRNSQIASVYLSEKLVGKMNCKPQSQRPPGNDMTYVSSVCDDAYGQDAGYRGNVTSGGFAGMSVLTLYLNVSTVAKLNCN